MLWLPPIAGDSSRRWLPLGDSSAVWLMEAILDDDNSSSALEELLSHDALLASWTAAQCVDERLPSTTLPELAVGLANHAVDWLQSVRYTETTTSPHDILVEAKATDPLPDSRARLLPVVIARLLRLEALEQRFDLELEEAKLSAMAEFAAGAGHEINNPLAVISGRAQLCIKNETDPQRRRDLSLISAQAMRIYEMIADMRLFARPPKPDLTRLDVRVILQNLLAELSPMADAQQTKFTVEPPAEAIELYGDAKQLHVALKAVCQNALEALGEGGLITMSARQANRFVEIAIADNGPGILPEQRPHIFDPYYSARQAGRGLGMGLSKCWRIVRNHGGQIEVRDNPGGGSIFTISLPSSA